MDSLHHQQQQGWDLLPPLWNQEDVNLTGETKKKATANSTLTRSSNNNTAPRNKLDRRLRMYFLVLQSTMPRIVFSKEVMLRLHNQKKIMLLREREVGQRPNRLSRFLHLPTLPIFAIKNLRIGMSLQVFIIFLFFSYLNFVTC
jgi:hypothetical protein